MKGIQFTLKRSEIRVYDVALTLEGFDPSVYRTNQLVECPPEHYAEAAVAFSKSQTQIFDEVQNRSGDTLSVSNYGDSYEEITEEIGASTESIMQKFANAVNEAGLSERAVKAMNDMDLPDMMPHEWLENIDPGQYTQEEWLMGFEITMQRSLLAYYDYDESLMDEAIDNLPVENDRKRKRERKQNLRQESGRVQKR